MPRDYYEVLGVPRNASKDEIKKAFRRMARQYHPDVNHASDAEARFKEINEAYEILADDNKRMRYDQFGHAGANNNAGGFGGMGGFGGIEDIFEEFFSGFTGRASTRRGPHPGADLRADVTITFEEAVFGVEKEIEFQRLETCDVCNGRGAENPGDIETCPQCHGSGEVRQVRQTFVGSVVRLNTCPTCGGKGTVVRKPCNACDGSGRRRQEATLRVKIPAGISDGLRIQVRGEGDAGEYGAPRGDLYVTVRVLNHEFFKRRDNDIVLDISINVAQATLGDHIIIPTVDGDVELKIPPGTQSGKIFRLRGKGIPHLRSDGSNLGRGDQLVVIQVVIPTKLTEEQRKLFEELAPTLGTDIQPQSNGRGFFDRIMDFLAGEPQQ